MKKDRRHIKILTGLIYLLVVFWGCTEEDNSSGTNQDLRIQLGVRVREVDEKIIETRGSSYGSPNQPVVWKYDNGKTVEGYAVTMNYISPKSRIQEQQDLMRNNQEPMTRARQITTSDFYDNYGLITFEHPSTTSFNESLTVKTKNEKVLKERGWMTQEYWPGASTRLTVFAYAPHSTTSYSGISLCNLDTLHGTPNMWYTVPGDVRNQNDLLVCAGANEKNIPGNYKLLRDINFDHVLTSVQIAVGDHMAPCKITRIQILGVYYQGNYRFGSSSWNHDANKTNYDANMGSVGESIEVFSTDQNRILNTGKWTFMLMPQVVPQGAKMVITINDGADHTIEADLSGHTWEMGRAVVYYISTAGSGDQYILNITSPTVLGTGGGRSYFYVTSYHKTYYGSQVPVKWEYTFKLDNDNTEYKAPVDYVTNLNQTSGNGGTSDFQLWMDIAEQTPFDTCAVDNKHTKKLRQATYISSTKDLSKPHGSANCYVINAPGKYSLPLVYGNTLTGSGGANSSALNLPNICDSHGELITAPQIYSKYVPYDAAIIWQDAPGLIKPQSLKLTGNSGGRYTTMEFEVPQNRICQGNAVLAVRDEVGMILWSWHIWVTDEKVLPDTASTFSIRDRKQNVRFFTQKPLGWCDKVKRYSATRKVEVRFRQILDDGTVSATASAIILQDEEDLELGARAPYYQWGRKDPMPPAKNTSYGDNNGNQRVPWYDCNTANNSNYSYYNWSILGAFKYAVQNPHVFYSGGYNYWGINDKQTYNNLWDAARHTDISYDMPVKTPYDPSPPGFVVPPSGAFTGFTRYGTGDTDGNNMFKNPTKSWSADENDDRPLVGWCMSQSGKQEGYYHYFPALGIRTSSNGNVYYYNGYGYYWTANSPPNDNAFAYSYFLHFTSGGIYPSHYPGGNGDGFTIWPCTQSSPIAGLK